MGRKQCSNCGNLYWVNPQIDSEYACPKCGYVDPEPITGQIQGRTSIADD
ncbi:MAG: hypothetical protein HYY22_10905 [Thaumarchaeota archaeon]|nr:hypothetical protein [Nitrososphaerota archaeon]